LIQGSFAFFNIGSLEIQKDEDVIFLAPGAFSRETLFYWLRFWRCFARCSRAVRINDYTVELKPKTNGVERTLIFYFG